MAEMFRALVIFVTLLTATVTANPVDALRSQLETVQCGGETEIQLKLTDEVTFNTDYILNGAGQLPSGCVLHYRIALETFDSLENWGLSVTGSVDLTDSANDDKCSSSSLLITDEDQEGDLSSLKHVSCGKKAVEFLTYEDSITVFLTVGEAQGRGFELTFKPTFACGGDLKGKKGDSFTFSTPAFPNPYPPNLSCIWDVKPEEISDISLQCNQFRILPQFRNRIFEYLMVQAGTDIRKFFGRKGPQTTYSDVEWMSMHFRSAAVSRKLPGFNCTVAFN